MELSKNNLFTVSIFVGVGFAKRAIAAAAKPTIEISENGGKYTIKTLSAFKNTEITFTLGEEFDEETADGRKARVSS
jgi:fatty acid-binding protein 7